MPSTLWVVLSFFAGAICGRYAEKIIEFLQFMRKDLARVRQETSKSVGQFHR